MKIIWLSQPILLLFIFTICFPNSVYSLLQCAPHDQSSLLRLKHSLLVTDHSDYWPFNWDSWNSNSDCCVWGGVTCNPAGDVIGLDLSYQSISGGLDPLFDLHHLRSLDLQNNDFNGTQIPHGIGKLVNLLHLDLSFSGFGGQVPIEISTLTSLLTLKLGDRDVYNQSPLKLENLQFSTLIKNLTNLVVLDLVCVNMSTNLSAPLPDFLANFSNLTFLRLSDCGLHGDFPAVLTRMLPLKVLDLSFNKLLSGTLPESIGNMTSLTFLYLYDCGFSGSITHIHWENLVSLASLDLSDNELSGSVPMSLFSLPSMFYLALNSNQFSGQLGEVDQSTLSYLDLSENKIHGGILPSLCNTGKAFKVVDLSNNSLSGTIPPCLLTMNSAVLNLKKNNLSGSIPDAFQGNCSLEILDLNENQLYGTVPESMVKCKALNVINLGNNKLNGGFPCWLTHISNLSVLVLRSNRFHGPVRCELSNSWSKLQIIDIAANSFHGELPSEIFKYWTKMMTQTDVGQRKSEYLGSMDYYQDSLTITNKGNSMELVKILTIFNAIDFSCNHFEGSIPQSIGDLKSLNTLNLSHNHFRGIIPPSIGNLIAMESLDLAYNSLNGIIPEQLASLTFISFLNLSFNHLVGRIPTSTQLQSFSEWSYMGNKGLYGPPLKINCGNGCEPPPLDPSSADVGKEVDWKLISAEIGYAVGLASVIGSLMFWKRWNVWFFECVDRIMYKVFPSFDLQKRNRGTRGHKTSQMQRQQ